jgi:tetratricopeptide (TPR) repeat protein
MFSFPPFYLLLALLLPFQTPRDSIRIHYEKAEASRGRGDLAGAENEYKAILGEAYIKLGKVSAALPNYPESVSALEAGVTYQPESDEALIDLAIAYFHVQTFDKALGPLNKAISRNPNSSAAHHMLGKTYFMLGEFDKAIEQLQSALNKNANDYDVEYTLGLAYLKRREMIQARRIYDHMIGQLGSKPQLHVLIGRAYRETGFLAESIDEFNKAVELDPRFPRVHFYLGLTYLLKDGADRLGDAEKQFKIELAEHPDEFFASYYLGITATVQRDWMVAVDYLQKAAKVQPENPDPYFFLGQAWGGLNKHELAIEAFRKSIALNPDVKHNDYQVSNAHYRLGQSLIKMGLTKEGEEELKASASLKTMSFKRDEAKIQAFTSNEGKLSDLVLPEGVIAEASASDNTTRLALQKETDFYKNVIAAAHNNIGMLRAERRDFSIAAQQFRLAKKWDPRLDGIDFNLGLASYKAEQFAEAVLPLEDELKVHPENLSAKQLLGLSYFMTDNFPRASALLTEVVSAKPNEAALYFPLAISLINEKKTDAANQLIQQMVAQGSSPQLHILLGRAAEEQGDSAKALEELKTAVSLDNKVLLAHFYAGLVYLKLGKFEEARKEFEAELSLNPNDWQAKYDLGYVLLAGQESERGIKLMREVVLQKPQSSDARYELGKALLQQGDTAGAIESLEAAAKLDPAKAHIHYQLGRAYIAAGRKPEGNSQFEISRQLKEKERTQTNP